jgi:protein-S-isoprenylcysteine O-methyltransferase Ste14
MRPLGTMEMPGWAIVRTIFWLIGTAALLFAAGGDLAWPQAWAFLAETAAASFGLGFWLARADPALLESRLSAGFHPDQGLWDRVFMCVAGTASVAWLVFAALDARRFRWSHTTIGMQLLGAGLIALCMILVALVFRANSFAAPQVRIQADRQQSVATTGPYAIVRHPMYVAAIIYFVGAPLLLGSSWALLPIPLFIIAFAARAVGEEKVLRQALPDYAAYAEKVRFRLIPGVW